MKLNRLSSAIPYRVFCCLLCGLLLTLLLAPLVQAQDSNPERKRAMNLLWEESKPEEALPLLQKLDGELSNDGPLKFALGFALLAHAKLLKTPAERKQTRLEARSHLLKARELGVNHPLLLSILESVPADGGRDDLFSRNVDADAAMREGEAAFIKGDLQAALNSYQLALQKVPQLYEAALFAGDMYFKMGQPEKAEEWYARAIKINPDRETAYRYSATPLLKASKLDMARARYIEAVIAEPYNRMSWMGLKQWADQAGVEMSHPRIEIPTTVTPKEDNKINITLDQKMLDEKGRDAGLDAWILYGLIRTSWNRQEFQKAFPREPVYRHTLNEESAALRAVVEAVKASQKDKKIKKLDPTLANLVKLSDEGLLEPFVLFALADRGIAQDYAEYRRLNRDKLRRYLVEYVTAH